MKNTKKLLHILFFIAIALNGLHFINNVFVRAFNIGVFKNTIYSKTPIILLFVCWILILIHEVLTSYIMNQRKKFIIRNLAMILSFFTLYIVHKGMPSFPSIVRIALPFVCIVIVFLVSISYILELKEKDTQS